MTRIPDPRVKKSALPRWQRYFVPRSAAYSLAFVAILFVTILVSHMILPSHQGYDTNSFIILGCIGGALMYSNCIPIDEDLNGTKFLCALISSVILSGWFMAITSRPDLYAGLLAGTVLALLVALFWPRSRDGILPMGRVVFVGNIVFTSIYLIAIPVLIALWNSATTLF